jgi:DNA primase large subunit
MPLSLTGLVKDFFSHFILRLAYCRSEDLRRWFLTNELELFKWRFVNNPPEDRNAWLRSHGLRYESISRDEYDELKQDLYQALASRRDLDAGQIDNPEHYKVPFEEVIDLVRQRKVFLREGFAYVPEPDLVSIVSTAVRAKWSRELSTTSRSWPSLREEEADRLFGFLEGLSTQYVGEDWSRPKGDTRVTLADLPAAARRSFPLCMHNMYVKLLETHHLKHSARHQFGLFLKSIGLTVDESMAFFKSEFCKKMPGDKFMKEYAYNIRYNYGLEGKRQEWSGLGCLKIIKSDGANSAAGEHHGCPFKNYDEGQMRATLQQMQVGATDVAFILEKVRGQHYQVACGKLFEAKHKGTTLLETEIGGIEHPGQFFDESVRFHLAQDKANGVVPAATQDSQPTSAEASA